MGQLKRGLGQSRAGPQSGPVAKFENGRISNFERLTTLTLTLTSDRVILHTVVHHSSTSTYMPDFIEIEETFCGRTDGFSDGHLRPALFGRLYRRVDLKTPGV